jgi:predicted glycoside hydrolase/deacetylase ChbG (UPF0249 family)
MTSKRRLIVNADDFGQCPGVNRGVIAAFERGIVTSASLMVRWPAAADAAAYARSHPRLGVGLHVDLGEWALRSKSWESVYTVVPTEDSAAVAAEVVRQLDAFRRLVGRDPTHMDSHQHVHRREPVRSVLVEAAHRLGVPLRHFTPGLRYCGGFYGQSADGSPLPGAISVEGLLQTLAGLGPGPTELACHPGEACELDSMYRDERAVELKTLCQSEVMHYLNDSDFRLCTFSEFVTPLNPLRG